MLHKRARTMMGQFALTAGLPVALGAQTATATTPRSLEILTSSVGGAYYVIGGTFAKQLQSDLRMPITAAPSSGAAENLRMMDNGSVGASLLPLNGLWPAWQGMEPYEKAYKDVRLVMYVNPVYAFFYALQSSGLTQVGDLKGSRVGVGTGAPVWGHISGPLLEAGGLNYETDITKVYGGLGDLGRMVGDGLLPASIGLSSAGAPYPVVQQLAAEKNLSYLEWNVEALDTLADAVPYFNRGQIPGSSLGGYSGEVFETVDIGGPYLTVRADLDDEFVYRMTRSLHQALPQMAADVAFLRWLSENEAAAALPAGDIPFHPGAERYWREVNLWPAP